MRIISRAGRAIASLCLALAFGAQTQAQGLGEITLDSALNQPLRAHIQLLDVGKLDASQINVALASPAEFDRAGVERGLLLAQLKFAVQMERDGSGQIIVSTTDEITEPYLDFLVGVSWPSGRTLREYTLLLDLPNNSKAVSKSAAVNPATAASPTATATPGPSSTDASGQYTVKKGDSLYQIAEQTRPANDVGVQQMMVAIQRANEDAFVNNNVNRILTGKVLRIPRVDEIRLIDQEAAVAQISQQNKELTSQPLAVNDSAGAKGAPARDELTLLSGDKDTGGGSNDLNATIKSLENQEMLSEESLDRSRLENLDLTNRLSAVQEQIDLLQNIITIEDQRIAQLQKQLSAQSAATKAAMANIESAAQSSTADEGGLLGLLNNSVVLLGGLLAVAVAVALVLFIRRRNAQAAYDQDADVALDDLAADRADDEEEPGGIRGMIAALKARFRRKEEDEAEEDEESIAAEAFAPAVTPFEKPSAKSAAAESTTNTLLDEMGISNDFLDTHSAMDAVGSDKSAPAAQPESPIGDNDSFMRAKDTAVEEAGAVMEEAALLEQSLNEAETEQQTETREEDDGHEDSDQSAPEQPAEPEEPHETIAFTADTPTGEPEQPASEPTEDKPEVFEFTLPDLDDDLKSEAPAAAANIDKPESIAFDSSPFSLDSSEEEPVEEPDSAEGNEALEVLGFDEDSLKLDDNDADESYNPAEPQDTHDARLDLAVAYEAMGDIDGAIEILDEVIASGRTAQVAEAKRLKQKWQNA